MAPVGESIKSKQCFLTKHISPLKERLPFFFFVSVLSSIYVYAPLASISLALSPSPPPCFKAVVYCQHAWSGLWFTENDEVEAQTLPKNIWLWKWMSCIWASWRRSAWFNQPGTLSTQSCGRSEPLAGLRLHQEFPISFAIKWHKAPSFSWESHRAPSTFPDLLLLYFKAALIWSHCWWAWLITGFP